MWHIIKENNKITRYAFCYVELMIWWSCETLSTFGVKLIFSRLYSGFNDSYYFWNNITIKWLKGKNLILISLREHLSVILLADSTVCKPSQIFIVCETHWLSSFSLGSLEFSFSYRLISKFVQCFVWWRVGKKDMCSKLTNSSY